MIIVIITPARNNANIPNFGWYTSHAKEKVKINNGIQTIKAARNIKLPTAPLMNPPTKGIKPRIYTSGVKKRYIPKTMIKYEPNLSRYVAFLFVFS